MTVATWQLQSPIDAIIFDCDGTLSAIEGIDELAKYNQVTEPVQALTAQAMGQTGLNLDLYQKRLALVQPQQSQLKQLGQQYFEHRVPDATTVIQIFNLLKKPVYIVSAGLFPAVAQFAALLQVPAEHVFAVDIQFNQAGKYLDFEHASPLVNNQGKRKIVQRLKKKYPRLIHIGDGLNDYVTYDLVTRFIGYGGVYYRENIEALCEYYIRSCSLAALLPLSLTTAEYEQLSPDHQILFHRGLAAIQNGNVTIPSSPTLRAVGENHSHL